MHLNLTNLLSLHQKSWERQETRSGSTWRWKIGQIVCLLFTFHRFPNSFTQNDICFSFSFLAFSSSLKWCLSFALFSEYTFQQHSPSLFPFIDDYRLFVGNLGKEVDNRVLLEAFQKNYPSAQKARVIHSANTTYTRGYGFVSFANALDYARAYKVMNGKYIGNRPCIVKKSNYQTRVDNDRVQRKKHQEKYLAKQARKAAAGEHGATKTTKLAVPPPPPLPNRSIPPPPPPHLMGRAQFDY